jgi:predicted  nucleic acid-binding Zn-ribbon protein
VKRFFIVIGGVFSLFISVFSASRDYTNREYTQPELLAMRLGHFANPSMMRLAETAQERLKGGTPEESEERLRVLHDKLGTADSLLGCIQALEDVMGEVAEGSLLDTLREIFARLGEEGGILTLIERHRNSLGGTGSLSQRILVLQNLIGMNGIIIPDLEATLQRMGFGGSLNEMIESALVCVGGGGDSVFQSITVVKEKIGGVGSLEDRIQLLYDLVPGEGTLLVQVQGLIASQGSGQLHLQIADLKEDIVRLTQDLKKSERETEEALEENAQILLEKEELAFQVSEQKKDLERLSVHLEAAEKKSEGLQEQLTIVEQEKGKLERDLEESKIEIEGMSAQLRAIQLEKEKLASEVKRLTGEVKEKEKEKAFLEKELKACMAEKERLTTRLDALQIRDRESVEKIKDLEADAEASAEFIRNLSRQKQELERTVSHLIKEAEVDQADIVVLTEVSERLEGEAKKAIGLIGNTFSSLPAIVEKLGTATIVAAIGDIEEVIGVEADLGPQAQAILNHVLRLLDGGMTVQRGSLRGVRNLKGLENRLLDLSQEDRSEDEFKPGDREKAKEDLEGSDNE